MIDLKNTNVILTGATGAIGGAILEKLHSCNAKIIATGTPSGVGFARTPPEFLKDGDMVECEIENIGRIMNKIVNCSHQ